MTTEQRVLVVPDDERVLVVPDDERVFVIDGDAEPQDEMPIVTRLQFGFLFLFPYEE